MRKNKHPYAAYLLLVLLLGLTFWFSSQQGMDSHNMSINICEKIVSFIDHKAKLRLSDKQYLNFVNFLDVPIRKAAHIAEYAILGAVLYVIVSAYSRNTWKQMVCVVGFLILTGSVDEIHQLFVIARNGKWQDVVVDVIGGCIGMLAAMKGVRRRY